MPFITTLQAPLVCRLQPPPIANSYDCNQPMVGSNIGGSAYRSRLDSSITIMRIILWFFPATTVTCFYSCL